MNRDKLDRASETLWLGAAIISAEIDYAVEGEPTVTLEIGEGRMLHVDNIKEVAKDFNSLVDYLQEKI